MNPDPESTQNRLPSGRFRRFFWLGLAAVLAVADLAVKALVENRLADGRVVDVGVMDLRLGYNTGVAFGIGAALPGWVVVGFTGIITAALAGYLWHQAATTGTRLQLTSLAMALGGAVGNLIDRMNGAGVIDYLHTGWFPTFNLADILITLGAATMASSALFAPRETAGRRDDPQKNGEASQAKLDRLD